MSAFATLPATGRAGILSLLSRLLLEEVDVRLLEELSREEVRGGLEALEPGVGGEIAAAREDAAAREALDVEYCRLFVLPGGVPPYAAAWAAADDDPSAARFAHGERLGTLLDVLGLRLQDFGRGRVPADHAGIALALAAVAHAKDAEGDVAASALDLLRPWGARFAAALAARSEARLYAAAGRLLEQVLA